MNRPYNYKNTDWLIFPDTLSRDISIDRCGNSVEGVCPKYDTIDECIAYCKDSKNCDFGYYTSYPEKSCLAVSNEIVNDDFNPTIGWVKASESDYSSQIKNNKIYSFVNSKIHPFPNIYSNTIYYSDDIFLKTGDKYLNSVGNPPVPKFSPEKHSVFKIAFYNTADPGVKINGDLQSDESLFTFKMYSGNFFLQKGDADIMILKFTNGEIPRDQLFTVSKKSGKPGHVSYGEEIYIKYGQGFLSLDSNGNPVLSDTKDTVFTIENRDSIYYCNNSKCEPVPANKVQKGVPDPKYNGKDTYKRDDCYNVCGYIDKKPIFPDFSDYISLNKDKYLNIPQKNIDTEFMVSDTPSIRYIIFSLIVCIIIYTILFYIFFIKNKH